MKWAIQQAFVDSGATLSHHHAVGHRARAVAGGGHLDARCGDDAGAVRGHRPRARTSTPGRSSRLIPTGGPEKPFRVAGVVTPMAEPADLDLPWTRTRAASRLRELLICGVLGPLMDLYTRRRVAGHEHLDDIVGPVVFVANHNSHMDTPVILRALPSRWRRQTAVAAATDYFYDKRRKALSASVAFGTVPLDRNSGAGVGPGQTAHLDRLIRDGGSLLFFPKARARTTVASGGCGRAPHCWPPSTTCRSCRSTCRAPARRCHADTVGWSSRPASLARVTRSRSASGSPSSPALASAPAT